MDINWTRHLKDPEEIENFQRQVLGAKSVLDHLYKILTSMEASLERQERSPKAYDSPNWGFRQADCNGYLRCLKEIQALINLDQKDDHERKFNRPKPT